jgi:hypothetical protein
LAQILLVAGIVGLVSEASVAVLANRAESEHSSGSLGGLIILITAPVIVMAVIWTIVLLVTLHWLGRYLKYEMATRTFGREQTVPSYVDCECGNRLAVNEGMAGALVKCGCGRTINMPSLRELRNGGGGRVQPEQSGR